jgi:hypothetical protein
VGRAPGRALPGDAAGQVEGGESEGPMNLALELRHGGEEVGAEEAPGRPRCGRWTGTVSGGKVREGLPHWSESQVTIPVDLGLVVVARR